MIGEDDVVLFWCLQTLTMGIERSLSTLCLNPVEMFIGELLVMVSRVNPASRSVHAGVAFSPSTPERDK